MPSYHLGADASLTLARLLTGNPWQVQIAKKIFAETGDPALKSFWGTQGWNTGLMNKLRKLSADTLLPGADRVLYMSANSGASENVVVSFLSYEGEIAEMSKDDDHTLDTFLVMAQLGLAAFILYQLKPIIGAILPKKR
jgi:hypothetical protein